MMKQKIKTVIQALVNAANNNPMECILALVAVVFGIMKVYGTGVGEYQLYYYPMLFLLVNIANKLTVSDPKRLIYYAISVLSLAIFFFFNVEPSGSYYVVGLGCVALAYLSFPLHSDNERFAENVLNNVVALLFAGFVAGVTFLLMVSIRLSIAYLFDLRSSGNDIECIAICTWVGLYPILFLAFNDNSLRLTLKNSFTLILFNYILTPAIIIYMLIFYAYFVKVAFQWELPKGNVAYMVFGFGIAAYLLKMLSYVLSKEYYSWLYRNLSYFVLPALLLFWIGTIYRVNEYGFTEDRIYLLIGGAYLTVASFVLISNKLGRYLYLSVGIIVVLSVFTYIPFVSAKTLGIKSQECRFEKALHALGYSKLDSTVRFKPLTDTPQNQKLVTMLTSSFDYIYQNTTEEYIVKHLGAEDPDHLEKILTSENYAMANGSADDRYQVKGLNNPESALNIQGYKTLVMLNGSSDNGCYYVNEKGRLVVYYNSKEIFSASKDELLKSQLAKAGISLRTAVEKGDQLTEQQQVLYRISIPQGVILVNSYTVTEQPQKVEDIYLYGILLK